MAKKKNSTPEVDASPAGRDALRLVSGLFSLVMGIFTLVALFSYLFTWAEDQSLLNRNDVWTSFVPVENGGGKIGFFWAKLLFSDLFGLGALIIPFLFLGLAFYCLKLKKVNLLKLFFITVYGAIILSIAFSYIFSFTSVNDLFGSGVGGSYGYFVNRWLISMLGATGAGAVIGVFTIVWLILISYKFVGWINGGLAAIFNRPKKVSDPLSSSTISDDISDVAAETDSATVAVPTPIPTPSSEPDYASGIEMEIIQADRPVAPADDIASEGDELGEYDPNEDDTLTLDDAADDEEDFLKDIPKETAAALFDPRLDLSNYKAPTVSLLDDYRDKWYEVPRDELEKNNRKIVKTLSDYKIGIEKIYARTGPTVTLYEIVPSAGVRISQIKRLEDDIALSLAARGVRIIAPIPGTNAVGIEVANDKPSIVPMKSVLEDPKFKNANYDLPIVLGRTISNEAMTFDLAKMPHLLVAGATGQGKSVGLNAILTSLLFTKHPSEMKLVLVDPKKVELSLYQKIEKHFLAKLPDAEDAIITDTQKVVYTLRSLCIEMDGRYDLLKLAKVRNIKEYNEKFLSRRLNPLKGHRFLPFIVVVIDEFADLLMTAGREVEEPIARLAQLARAIGIHLVIATQRPTTNIITGLIKANFPARIAFRVISNIDSRTILDTTGANQLVGRGDMLISTGGDLTRVQCAFVDTHEIERITDHIGNQQGYPSAHYLPEYTGEDGDAGGIGDVDLGKRDKMFEEAARLIVQYQQGSTSLIQRRMNLGYNRAGRIMDQLEAAGIVGPSEGSKARQVLVTDFNSLDRILASLN
ncbi:MAG: DNA translocase FtsK 4TM domain-containing protein [Bacteroidales bacterium]